MATLFGILGVTLTIAIIFGRRVARWVVMLGLVSVVIFSGVLIAYFWWCDWSSGHMELNAITNSFLDEQMKSNLPLNREIPFWRIQELAKETQSEMHKRHIIRLSPEQVARIVQYEEKEWETRLDSPEYKLETLRGYRKSLGDTMALQLLSSEDKQLLKRHPDLLTDEERKFLEPSTAAKPGEQLTGP